MKLFLAFLLSGWLAPVGSLAYTPTVMGSGQPIRWSGGPALRLALNTSNTSGLSDAQARDALVRGLQRWQEASGGRVAFDVWHGTDRAIYEPSSAYNGLSSVYFSSAGGANPGSNVLGVTEVWYESRTGEILEVDTMLNDQQYQFTTDPRDTTGFGSASGPNSGQKPRVFIENVVTHELGHAIGLSHSSAMQSSMLYVEAPEQARLACDDRTAVRALYPAADAGARGGLTGRVVSPSGQPVFGAHALAISRARGTMVASAVTDRDGRYVISALEPGIYFVMIEPFFAGASALPAYYAGASSQVCGSTPFARTPLLDASGFRLLPMAVGAGQLATAPQLGVTCPGAGGIGGGTDLVLHDGLSDPTGFGGVDRLSFSGTRFYELRNVSGRLDLRTISYSIYSPLRARATLYDAQGTPVAGVQVRDTVYQGESGYVNYDTQIVASNLAPGRYYLGVMAESLAPYLYPAGSVSLDTVPYVVYTGTINGGSAPLSAALPENARCRSSENFAEYRSPGGNPPRADLSDGGGFCGTIAKESGRQGDRLRPSGAPRLALAAGWFLPWVLMLAVGRLFVRRPWRKMEA